MMKVYNCFKNLLLTTALTVACFITKAQFTPGNLALFTAASASNNNTTGSIVEINTTSAGQAPINTFAIPSSTVTLTNQLRFSGSATSTGYLSNSSDGSLVCFTGSNTINTTSNVNTQQNKGVGTFDAAGTYTLQTTYTGTGTNQARSASTLDNTAWFIGDQGGFYTNGVSAASPTTNTRSVKAFGNTVYGFTASASLPPVFTISGTSGAIYTSLPGLANGATSRQDFYLISSGSNGTAFDVLYVLDATSATAGTIFKYSLVSGSWTANGTYITSFGGFGMAAKKSGTGAELFVSSGTGATAANNVIKLTDAAGYNATIAITTANNIILHTAAAGTVVKGMAFAPVVSTATPTVSLSVSANAGTEAGTTAITVTATASAAVTGNQTVDLAVTGTGITAGDYTLSNTTITIPGGSTTGSVTFTVVDDVDVEGLETAVLTISNPSAGITLGSPLTQNIAITDNDIALPTVSLGVSTNMGSEAAGSVVTVTATASAPVTGNQTVTLAVAGTGITATDFRLSGTTITILGGQTTGSVTFTVRNDAEAEGTETAILTISAPSAGITLGTPVVQNIVITDNSCQPLIRRSTATSTSGAEISAYDSSSKRIFTVAGLTMEYYSLSNTGIISGPSNLPFGFTSAGNNILPNSVAVRNGIVAVGYAIVNTSNGQQQPGVVAFYNAATATYISQVAVGYLPDMITFTPDGTKLLTANEGEPNSYGQPTSFDPEGSVSIIDISGGVAAATVQNAGFTSFNGQAAALRAAGVRIYGPGATVAQDMEPEYIAFSADGSKAFVTLQENNAVAEVDIATATVTQILPLGLKDHSLAGNGLDASDRDLAPGFASGSINIQNWPVRGMYQPDAIASFNVGGTTYYITANEGDSRDYTGFTEEIRVGTAGYVLDPTVFPNAATLKLNQNLGRLQLTNATGDTDSDGDFDEIHALGARSFTIWNSSFTRIFDSGDQLEQITAAQTPLTFNSDGTTGSFDGRSDNKGPEPEAVTTGTVDGVLYAFVGSERTGDIFVYDISNPAAPVFKQYIDNPTDLAVEGLLFVPANESPTGRALVIATAEVSRTVTVYEFSLIPAGLATVNTNITAMQGNTTSYGDCGGLVAKVNQAGGSPVAGNVNARVWIEPTVPAQGGIPFVQRHYEITPAANAATATGRVTLYFTQAEFDNFNNDPASATDLPTGPADAIGIGNLRVIKYPGVSNDGSGLPASYTSTPQGIDPADADIVWNAGAARWEVSFDVTGFSGFFVQTNTSVLPVNLIAFTAQVQGNDALVQWKSTSEINHAYYEVEYSIDGRNFTIAGQRNALNGSGEKNYSLTHINAAALSSKLYYRLKMVANTGNSTYSNTVLVRFGNGGAAAITDVYPNPTNGLINIVTTGIATGKPVQLRLTDISGRVIATRQVLVNGSSTFDISNQASGIYLLQAILADGGRQQFKVIKQID
jgi:Secretion system C-terminal sorting domain/Calx-beta domain